MKTELISHIRGWQDSKRTVTEYRVIPHEKGNTVYTSQRWYYNVQLYTNIGKVTQLKSVGHNIDLRV